MSDLDLSKICGNEPPLSTDADEVARLLEENAVLRADLDRAAIRQLEWQVELLKAQKVVEALRARLTLTPQRIEAAAAAAYTKDTLCRWDRAMPDERSEYLETAAVMLKAAGMEQAEP